MSFESLVYAPEVAIVGVAGDLEFPRVPSKAELDKMQEEQVRPAEGELIGIYKITGGDENISVYYDPSRQILVKVMKG